MEVARAAVFIRRIYSLWQSIDNFHRTDGRRSSDLARDVLSALIFSRRGKLATAVCCADVSCAFFAVYSCNAAPGCVTSQ
jgi:hypothetical protein